ncbi:phage gene 29 protein family protein [Mycolicibacterium fortuitum]|uniref:phage gene 29 protein family protein n=1 Tax=Mycolicibacterium fortuitum TaxID=1766 RepID=UPI00261B40EB|nr:DUF2744 domain-containing protein [Mycolicibacterium fortuitum]
MADDFDMAELSRPPRNRADVARRRKALETYKFQGFPTRANCDMSDPKQMFLWMLVALPAMRGAQLAVPVAYNMMISEHLHKCGARYACDNCGHIADPKHKYQPPATTDPHWLTSPGQWVHPDAPDTAPHPARKVIGEMSQQQRTDVFAALVEHMSPQQKRDLLLQEMTPDQVRELLATKEDGDGE